MDKKINVINGVVATFDDLLELWKRILQGTEKIVFVKNGSHFTNFVTR